MNSFLAIEFGGSLLSSNRQQIANATITQPCKISDSVVHNAYTLSIFENKSVHVEFTQYEAFDGLELPQVLSGKKKQLENSVFHRKDPTPWFCRVGANSVSNQVMTFLTNEDRPVAHHKGQQN